MPDRIALRASIPALIHVPPRPSMFSTSSTSRALVVKRHLDSDPPHRHVPILQIPAPASPLALVRGPGAGSIDLFICLLRRVRPSSREDVLSPSVARDWRTGGGGPAVLDEVLAVVRLRSLSCACGDVVGCEDFCSWMAEEASPILYF